MDTQITSCGIYYSACLADQASEYLRSFDVQCHLIGNKGRFREQKVYKSKESKEKALCS